MPHYRQNEDTQGFETSQSVVAYELEPGLCLFVPRVHNHFVVDRKLCREKKKNKTFFVVALWDRFKNK
jgi:hypothetical protein